MIYFPYKGIKVVPLDEKTYEDNQFFEKIRDYEIFTKFFLKGLIIIENRQSILR